MGALHSSEANQAYFAALMARDGVMVTPQGAVYEVLQPSSGQSPVMGASVCVNYRGILVDGSEFDLTYARNQPAEFSSGKGMLIDGWIEGLPLMTVGSTYRFYLPCACLRRRKRCRSGARQRHSHLRN